MSHRLNPIKEIAFNDFLETSQSNSINYFDKESWINF